MPCGGNTHLLHTILCSALAFQCQYRQLAQILMSFAHTSTCVFLV